MTNRTYAQQQATHNNAQDLQLKTARSTPRKRQSLTWQTKSTLKNSVNSVNSVERRRQLICHNFSEGRSI